MGERFKDPTKNFGCSFLDCKASFSKLWKLEAHYSKHTGLRPFVCDSCDKSFCTRCRLTRHRLSHSGEKPYQCSDQECTKAFSTSNALKNHIERVHERKEKLYVCDSEGCGKEFHKKKQLKTHKCEHTNLLAFECRFNGCENKYITSKALKKHEKVHQGYPCAEEGCPFHGKTWTEYQVHRHAEHRVTVQCEDCNKVFKETWFLKNHKRFVHLGERRVFKCTKEGCGKTYTKRFNLQNHILSFHEGKRSFVCSQEGCGKAFAMEESLKRHGVVHDPMKKKLKKPLKPRRKSPKKSNVPDASVLSECLQNISLNKSPSQNSSKP